MVFALSACASKEYKDTVVTIPVTDENGKEVTDSSGKVVTEVVTERATDGASSNAQSSSSDEKTTKKGESTTASKEKTTKKASSNDGKEKTSAGSNGATASNEETTKKAEATTTTTTQAPTEKPKKRMVTVKVVLPYYNDQETKLSVSYKTGDDIKHLEFENPDNKKEPLTYELVKLDGKTVKAYELGEIKGDVTVRIEMTGVDITNKTIVIPASKAVGTITPNTGIEMMVGDDM